MIAQTIMTSTVFFFSSSDLADLGLHPHTLTQEDALTLIRSCCIPPALDKSLFSEIQVFSTQDGVLLFLRPFSSSGNFQASSSVIFS